FEANNATVIAADIEADNGVIHVIDNVMLMRPHWFYPIMESGKVGVV
ncbi:MAG: fasciclin domain-containing protein, partial [Pseudanabaena sp.]